MIVFVPFLGTFVEPRIPGGVNARYRHVMRIIL
jgi:hypothetical protein